MRRTDRDTIVAKGIAADRASNASMCQKGPWVYKSKVKSGRNSTVNVEDTFTSIPHLNGEMIQRHAREGETLNVYAVTRIMKATMRSYREDI